jgi:glycosyltransferase involved in cell wall biosynthesis
MKIVVNTRMLIANKLSGIGWFKYHTLKRLVQWHPEVQFVFLFDRKFNEEFIFGSNVHPEVIYPPARHPFLWYYWFEQAIPGAIKKHQPDLFFSPDGYLSLKIKEIPSLPVIHDLNFHHFPDDLTFLSGRYYRRYFPKFAHHAKRILTVSEYSKNDISSFYNIPKENIDVAYNGANDLYCPLDESSKSVTKEEYTNGCEYFIYIGDLLPRKNITRMIKAFEEFKTVSGSRTKLLIVGQKFFLTSEIEKTYLQSYYKDDIIFTGRLEPGKLKNVLGSARALILVSYFEGFGIPVIEAMNSDVPVIASNVTSLPEVAGDAALFTDPYSIDSIKDAMVKIDTNEGLRNEFIERGKIRRKKFSWDNTATCVWESIEKTVKK